MRILVSGLVALVWTIATHAQDFTRTMTAEERTAAGLGKLSPTELANLAAAVERYKAGEVAVVQEQAEQRVAVTAAKVKEAEQKAAVAEAKAKEAAAKSGDTSGVEKKKRPGWVAALLTLERAENAPDAEVLESRLAGELRSFAGRRDFQLENGQIWRMIEADEYAGPILRNPAVTVRPAPLGAFWLKIPDGALRVKVKPLKLE